MAAPLKVLLIAGTHGNEVNAPWLFDQWQRNSELINTYGISVAKIIGNPLARKVCKRYLDCDLNRSFTSEVLDAANSDYEVNRAKELCSLYGPTGKDPCQIAIDFHSTTASMGCSLVVYGRRPADLALASLLQNRLGLPIYLHEGNKQQNGFLVESWPCGLVIEIGPVAQGLLHERIVHQTRIALEVCLEELGKIKNGEGRFPDFLIIHRHIKNIDFPRDDKGSPHSFIHHALQDKDWRPISFGSPLFQSAEGAILRMSEMKSLVPVFINEAAYLEKNISLGFTKREVWTFTNKWELALKKLFN